ARTVVALDQFLTESVKQADVVLPVAGFAEVDGTTTNIEGRVSVLARKVTAPGTAQSDWTIAADLAQRLGHDLGLESPRQIAAEIEAVAPSFAGLTLDVLTAPAGRDGVIVGLPTRRAVTSGNGETAADEGSVVVAAESSEGAHVEMTATKLLPPTSEVPLPVWTIIEPPKPDAYSLRLVVTRKLYDRGTLVRSSPSLADLAEPATLRLNPHDFDNLGIAPGDDVRITSGRGNITVPTLPHAGVPRGIAHLHANKAGGRANMLIDGTAPITDVRVERP